MARDKKKKSPAADRRRPIKKKTSILSSESIDFDLIARRRPPSQPSLCPTA